MRTKLGIVIVVAMVAAACGAETANEAGDQSTTTADLSATVDADHHEGEEDVADHGHESDAADHHEGEEDVADHGHEPDAADHHEGEEDVAARTRTRRCRPP